MNADRNLSNQLNLKFSDYNDIQGYQNYGDDVIPQKTWSTSKLNDGINDEFHCQSKENILQRQKEAAIRRMRQQFRMGIVTDPSPHNDERILSTPNVTANFHQYSISSVLEVEGHDYSESRNEDISSYKSLNQLRDTNIKEIDRFATDSRHSDISRLVTPPVFRSSSLVHMKQSPIPELDGCKDGAVQKPALNCSTPSSILKENATFVKEMNTLDTDRQGLTRSSSTNSDVNKKSLTEDPDNLFDNYEENDTEDEISSNILPIIKCHHYENVNWENAVEVKQILMEPVPKEYGMVKCYVKRYRGKSRLSPEYRVYLDGSNQFLMTSKKRAKKTSSNYLISIGRNDYSKSSSNIIGKLRANFLGTEFQVYDAGKNPKHLDSFFDEKNYDEPRCELGAILYSSNIIGNRGPRKMQVCINRVSEHGECVKRWQPAVKDEEMLECFKAKNETARKHLLIYENRQPKWNEDIGSYVLNFDKRVSLASVKNFQLIDPTSSNGKVLMQFGKKGQDEFIMDVQYPLSLFQAFAVSLSSCDSKLGVD